MSLTWHPDYYVLCNCLKSSRIVSGRHPCNMAINSRDKVLCKLLVKMENRNMQPIIHYLLLWKLQVRLEHPIPHFQTKWSCSVKRSHRLHSVYSHLHKTDSPGWSWWETRERPANTNDEQSIWIPWHLLWDDPSTSDSKTRFYIFLMHERKCWKHSKMQIQRACFDEHKRPPATRGGSGLQIQTQGTSCHYRKWKRRGVVVVVTSDMKTIRKERFAFIWMLFTASLRHDGTWRSEPCGSERSSLQLTLNTPIHVYIDQDI